MYPTGISSAIDMKMLDIVVVEVVHEVDHDRLLYVCRLAHITCSLTLNLRFYLLRLRCFTLFRYVLILV